jgi:hypothetical protein
MVPDVNENLNSVHITLEHWPLTATHREVKFGFVDFLVAFGSIMALFLSFSILSAIEMLLYIFHYIGDKLSDRLCPKTP